MRIYFIRPQNKNSRRLIIFSQNPAFIPIVKEWPLNYRKIEIMKTRHLVAFLMPKMDSTQNFSVKKGIT